MLISERACSVSSSQNAFCKCLATKLIRQQQLQIKGNHLSMQKNLQCYPQSEISSFIPLKATLPVLFHTDWLLTVLVRISLLENCSIYPSGLDSLTSSNKSQLDRSFCDPLLPSVSICYSQIQFTNNVIKTLMAWVKAPVRAHYWMIQ